MSSLPATGEKFPTTKNSAVASSPLWANGHWKAGPKISRRFARSDHKAGHDNPGASPTPPDAAPAGQGIYEAKNTPARHCERETAKAGPVLTRRDQRMGHDTVASVNGLWKRRADPKTSRRGRYLD